MKPRFRFFLCLITFLSLVEFSSSIKANDERAFEFKIFQDTDLPGYDLNPLEIPPSLKNTSLDECKQSCQKEKWCKAFTFNQKSNWCFLKIGFPQKKSHSGAISGIKTSHNLKKKSQSYNLQFNLSEYDYISSSIRSRQNDYLIVSPDGKSLQLWDLTKKSLIRAFDINNYFEKNYNFIEPRDIHPNNRFAIIIVGPEGGNSRYYEQSLAVIDLTDGTVLDRIPHYNGVNAKFSKDGSKIYLAALEDEDGWVLKTIYFQTGEISNAALNDKKNETILSKLVDEFENIAPDNKNKKLKAYLSSISVPISIREISIHNDLLAVLNNVGDLSFFSVPHFSNPQMRKVKFIKSSDSKITSFYFVDHQKILFLTGHQDGQVIAWGHDFKILEQGQIFNHKPIHKITPVINSKKIALRTYSDDEENSDLTVSYLELGEKINKNIYNKHLDLSYNFGEKFLNELSPNHFENTPIINLQGKKKFADRDLFSFGCEYFDFWGEDDDGENDYHKNHVQLKKGTLEEIGSCKGGEVMPSSSLIAAYKSDKDNRLIGATMTGDLPANRATASFEKSFGIWDLTSGQLIKQFFKDDVGFESAVVNIASDQFAYVGHYDGRVERLNLQKERSIWSQKAFISPIKQIIPINMNNSVAVMPRQGGVQFRSQKNGELLATLYILPEDNWVMITPEGFFSAGDVDKIKDTLNIVHGLEVYSLSTFFEKLYSQRMVNQKLLGDPRGIVREEANKINLKDYLKGPPPKIELIYPRSNEKLKNNEIEIKFRIEDNGGGVKDADVRINNVSYSVKIFGEGTYTYKTTLTEPINKIEIRSWNKSKTIFTATKPLEARVPKDMLKGKGNLHILAIGINDYVHDDGQLKDLKYAVRDANILAKKLVEVGKNSNQYIDVIPHILVREKETDKFINTKTIESKIHELEKIIQPQDVFIFFLAGHGRNVDRKYYYIPQDFDYLGHKSRNAAIKANAIGTDKLKKWLKQIKAQKNILIVDSCDSGSILREDFIRGDNLETTADALDRLKIATGRAIILAAGPSKVALEGYKKHGALTYALLEGLDTKNGEQVKDGKISLFEWSQYIRYRVPQITELITQDRKRFKQPYRQTPMTLIFKDDYTIGNRIKINFGGREFSESNIPIKENNERMAEGNFALLEQSTIYAKQNLQSKVISTLAKGDVVQVVKNYSYQWILVARKGKKLGYLFCKKQKKSLNSCSNILPLQ